MSKLGGAMARLLSSAFQGSTRSYELDITNRKVGDSVRDIKSLMAFWGDACAAHTPRAELRPQVLNAPYHSTHTMCHRFSRIFLSL